MHNIIRVTGACIARQTTVRNSLFESDEWAGWRCRVSDQLQGCLALLRGSQHSGAEDQDPEGLPVTDTDITADPQPHTLGSQHSGAKDRSPERSPVTDTDIAADPQPHTVGTQHSGAEDRDPEGLPVTDTITAADPQPHTVKRG